MKIKTEIVGPHEIRLTRQSLTARYGAGCYVVRRLTHGKKREEFSTADEMRAIERFLKEVEFCKRLTT